MSMSGFTTDPALQCDLPPKGWACYLEAGHDGPCPTWPVRLGKSGGPNRPDGFTFHNLVGHPVSEVLYLLGFEQLSNRVHDQTYPKRFQGDARG